MIGEIYSTRSWSPPTSTSTDTNLPSHLHSMGSDVGVRLPPLDTAAAKARRHLAAARAARDGITTMVDALRISKPPRAPSKLPTTPTSVPIARRHALIPLAEGRPELEARIHALEDVVAARDAELLTLKREWGRGLIKRNFVQRDRDSARADAAALRDAAKASSAVAHTTRNQFVQFLDDISAPLPPLHQVLVSDACETALPPQLKDELAAALDDIEEILSTARDSLETHPLPPALPQRLQKEKPSVSNVKRPPLKPRNARGPSSVPGSDDDSKSCASFASSSFFGENRETQLDALVELIGILESKISAGPAHPPVNGALRRAKRTVTSARMKLPSDFSDIMAERDTLKAQLNAVMAEKEKVGGEDAAMALAAKAQAELRDANDEIAIMRMRVASHEKSAERVVKQDELASKNVLLTNELRNARKTIGRLIQDKSGMRRSAVSGGLQAASPMSSQPPLKGNTDAMRRVLDWRNTASSENQDVPVAGTSRVLFERNHISRDPPCSNPDNDIVSRLSRTEALPDRQTRVLQRRLHGTSRVIGSESSQPNEVNSLSDRSLDVGGNDSASVQSLPRRGFMSRHDSFLSTGNISASGEEVTISKRRNIFSTVSPSMDGLRALLG